MKMSGREEPVAMEIGWLQRSGVSGEESSLGYTTNILSSASGYTTLCGGYGERAEKETFHQSNRQIFSTRSL
jgi:hypothetical protein